MTRARIRARLESLERRQAAELEQEHSRWLESLSQDQLEFFLLDLLARLAKDGLAPDLAGKALSDLSTEEYADIFALADKMQKRDPVLAGERHSEAILATVNRWPDTWPDIKRWLR